MAETYKKKSIPTWVWTIAVFLFVTGAVLILFSGETDNSKTFFQKLTQAADYPICAGGNYDFSGTIVPGEVKVDFRSDCSSKVTLPPGVVFRTDPSSDTKIVFIDGSSYIDGPGRQVWYGLKRGIFKMHGLKEAGIMKITLEKRS
ncbi:MAG TPA: hypothetical protein ENH26_00650 [Candidatus Wolfebacteria bacterium]|nr:hypothetical protein [Candidatus Wolfebacteria bacterium]